MENQEKHIASRKTLRGVVVSDKMDKTRVCLVSSRKKHPIYKKFITFTKKYKFHDEKNESNVGDTVEIMETRPLSKDKYFRLLSIVERAK